MASIFKHTAKDGTTYWYLQGTTTRRRWSRKLGPITAAQARQHLEDENAKAPKPKGGRMTWQERLRGMIHDRYGAKRFVAQHMKVSESTLGRWAYRGDTPPRHKVNETVGRLALALTELTGKPVTAQWLLDGGGAASKSAPESPDALHRALGGKENRLLASLLEDPTFLGLARTLAEVYDRARPKSPAR